MSTRVSLAVITAFLAFISPATAVDPYLDINFWWLMESSDGATLPTPQNFGILHASLAPLVHQESIAQGGGSASAASQTAGISLITLPQHPGRLFYHTGSLGLRSNAHSANFSSTSEARLGRKAVWRFVALSPRLNGVTGTVRMTFNLSWDLRRTVINGQYTGVLFWDVGTNMSREKELGARMRDVGSMTDVRSLPIIFGNSIQYDYGVSTTGRANSGWGNYQTIAQGASELWSVEVFDAVGQKLTRFVDYEWYELSGPTEEPVFAASSQEAAVPLLLNSAVEGSDLMLRWPSTRPGVLYQVADLVGGEWEPATQDKTLDFDSWVVRVPMNQPRMFFRLKAEADAP